VILHHAIDEGEADAAALGLGGEEGLEDVRKVVVRDAVPGVGDPELQRGGIAGRHDSPTQTQLPALWHGLHGIDAEIPHRLAELLGIDTRGQPLAELPHHLELGGQRAMLEEQHHLFQEIGEIDGVRRDGRGARVLQEVPDDAIEAIGLA
jgi:hypothetical protein